MNHPRTITRDNITEILTRYKKENLVISFSGVTSKGASELAPLLINTARSKED